MTLPQEFTSRMSELLAGEYPDFIKSYDESPFMGLRANTLKITPADLKKLLPGILGPVDWCETGFYFDPEIRPGKSPYYHGGLFYIQEPSAMSPGAVMDISPGQRVLDLCAAPGGKSTQLAAKLEGSGVLVANDVSVTRGRALLKNIELAGVKNAVVTGETPARLAARFRGYFDRVLVDAPCSGEGMFRKDPEARKRWSLHKPGACVVLQRESLHFAAQMLRPGGRLMYSTCTFSLEENELMITDFLSRHPEFSGVDIGAHGLSRGLYGEDCTARIWPHRQQGEGHFLAYLQKSGEETLAYNNSPGQGDFSLYYSFCKEYLTKEPEGMLELHGRSLFLLPFGLPSLKGMRLLRGGLYLGDILTKRFEPSQAFAMTLTPGDVKRHIDFSISDPGVYRYLKGESFEVPCDDGWNLVTLSGWPLGWAKAAGGRIKNKYLKGWLMN